MPPYVRPRESQDFRLKSPKMDNVSHLLSKKGNNNSCGSTCTTMYSALPHTDKYVIIKIYKQYLI